MNMIKFEDLKKGADGLVPAIVQDKNTLQVLMLGYMNAESLQVSAIFNFGQE